MKKIGYHERDQARNDDPEDGARKLSESSFSPCEYKPVLINGEITATEVKEKEDDELYLPCHYFTYAGGTSTGGYVKYIPSLE